MIGETPPRDALRDFSVFAEELNFTRAAERLGTSQPSLHAKVGRLQEWAGVALYGKSGRRLHLTEAGERLARYGRSHVSMLESLRSELQTGADARPVRLAAGEGALLYLLGPALRRFVRSRAGKLSVHPVRGELAKRMLLEHRCELAVRVVARGKKRAGGQVDNRVHRQLLARSRCCVVVGKSDPWAERAGVSLDELFERELIVSPPGGPLRETLEGEASRRSLSLRVAVEASGWPLTLQLCRLGVGAAVVNDIVKLPPGLVARPLEGLAELRYELLTLGPTRAQREPVQALLAQLMAD